MPIIHVNDRDLTPAGKLAYLKSIAPTDIFVGFDNGSFYAGDRIHPAALIFEDFSKINFWADEVPAWLIELATGIERKTLVPVHIDLITPKKET